MASVQKERRVRARVEGIYNKRENDFASRSAYDDYLEEREDIIYNLVEGEAVEEMEAKIAAYQRENKDSIVANEARKAEEARSRAQQASRSTAQAEPSAPAAEPAMEGQQLAGDTARYTATAAMPVAPAPAQPAPRQAATVSNGTAGQQQAMVTNTQDAMAQASGWDPSVLRERLLQEAYSTVFLKPLPGAPGQVV